MGLIHGILHPQLQTLVGGVPKRCKMLGKIFIFFLRTVNFFIKLGCFALAFYVV